VAELHVAPAVEVIVEYRTGYVVVEKLGAAGDEAERLDPRDG
jgi:hypothetical protein